MDRLARTNVYLAGTNIKRSGNPGVDTQSVVRIRARSFNRVLAESAATSSFRNTARSQLRYGLVMSTITRNSGTQIVKQDINWPCDICARSTERGWLWLPGGDWVLCPQCEGSGKITGVVTGLTQTRKIILPQTVGVNHV
jgi:hypothetical protein